MNHPYILLQPLLWSLGFAFGSILLKRALDHGAGPLRIAFLNNMAAGLLFLPGLLTLPQPVTWDAMRWPLLSSLVYAAGQVLFFIAMRTGDVTVIAPALGSKVVFVAVFTVMLGAGIMPGTWWVAAFLAAAAIFLLGMSNWHDRKRLARTAVLAVSAAALYSLNDVLVQMHAPQIGAPAYSAVVFAGVALESFLLLPFFRQPLRTIPRAAWAWTFWGCVICGAQAGGMAYTLGHYGGATAINVVYSTRGLWSILMVWTAGSWFGNDEQKAGTSVMVRRLAGAVLLLGAVGLVLAGK